METVYAGCPVCIISVGGGLWIAKVLGIDSAIVAVWLSAFNTAFAFWLASLIKKKPFNNKWVLSMFFYLFTFFYFKVSKQITRLEPILGMDRVVFGLSLGMLLFFTAELINSFLKRKNAGRVLFPSQKVAISVAILVFTSLFLSLIKL